MRTVYVFCLHFRFSRPKSLFNHQNQRVRNPEQDLVIYLSDEWVPNHHLHSQTQGWDPTRGCYSHVEDACTFRRADRMIVYDENRECFYSGVNLRPLSSRIPGRNSARIEFNTMCCGRWNGFLKFSLSFELEL